MTAEIRLAQDAAELEALFAFRYRIYVEELARPQKYADHAAKMIRDPLDGTAYNFIAWTGNEIVGCIRINLARDGAIDYYRDLLRMDDAAVDWRANTSLSTRFMIAPDWRGTTLAIRLASTAYEFGLVNGIEWNFIDCYDNLATFFRRLGWIQTHAANHEEYGAVNAMRLDLLDGEHLEQIKSPFCSLLRRHTQRASALSSCPVAKEAAA